jgi:hypothetical protein
LFTTQNYKETFVSNATDCSGIGEPCDYAQHNLSQQNRT